MTGEDFERGVCAGLLAKTGLAFSASPNGCKAQPLLKKRHIKARLNLNFWDQVIRYAPPSPLLRICRPLYIVPFELPTSLSSQAAPVHSMDACCSDTSSSLMWMWVNWLAFVGFLRLTTMCRPAAGQLLPECRGARKDTQAVYASVASGTDG